MGSYINCLREIDKWFLGCSRFGTRFVYLVLHLYGSIIIPRGFNCQGKWFHMGIAPKRLIVS